MQLLSRMNQNKECYSPLVGETSAAICAYNFIIEDVRARLVRFLLQPKKIFVKI